MVFHGSRLVFMVPGRFASFFMVPVGLFIVPGRFSWFYVVPSWFSWFFMVPGWFVKFYLQNAPARTVSWPYDPV